MNFLAIQAAVPETKHGWNSVRFKAAFAPIEKRVGDRDVPRLSLSSMGYLYAREGDGDRQQASDSTIARSLEVAPGHLVINPMWLTGGSIAVSGVSGAVSPDYRVFRSTTSVYPRFAHFLLRSQPYMDQYKLFVRANTTFDRRVQQGDINAMPLLLPPPHEQRRIADFLDDRVSRIDRIIAARREQMSLLGIQHVSALQELFDALVRRFGVLRLGHVLRGLEQGWSPQAESQPAGPDEWGVMRAGCVNGGHFRPEDNKRLPDHLEPVTAYEICAGDLLVSRASGSLDLIGSVAVVPADVRSRLLLCDKIYRLFPERQWMNEFIAPMMRTQANRELIRLGVSGAEGMANNLPSGVIRDLRIPAAKPGVQRQVAKETTALGAQAQRAGDALARSNELLAEYKSSLITAAVTGELDVSTAGSSIPG